MFPHIRFAAYLLAKKKTLSNIKGLPIPTPEDIARVFPNVRGTKKWYEFAQVEELNQKTTEIKLAYMLWANVDSRIFMYVAILRSIHSVADLIKQHFRIPVNDRVLELYRSIFFDVSNWTRLDLENYATTLEGVDRHVFEACLSTTETESILTEMGVKLVYIDHDSYLHNMFFMAYEKFMKSEDLSWGKFVMQLERRITDVSQLTKRDILKDLNLELEGLRQAEEFEFEDLESPDLGSSLPTN